MTADGKEYQRLRVWPGPCGFPDFTRPETRLMVERTTIRTFSAKGVDGVWNDMNEPSVFDSPTKTMPEEQPTSRRR